MNNNETIKDILAEMRDFAEHRDFDSDGNVSTSMLRHYADRIEAAAFRERVEVSTVAATQAINLTNEKWRRESGNNAAPARNCDRFATADEARDAVKAAFANTMLLDDRQLRAVCDWLFAKAEGGAE